MGPNGRRDDGDSPEALRTQLERLAEENEQLRESYTQAKRTKYRRTALGLAAIGIAAALGGLVVPTAQNVLFALGGTGLFGGILTYYLTPEQFVAADVGRDVYAALAGNEAALVAELGLSEDRIYVPVDGAESGVRLFVPQREAAPLPDAETLRQTVVSDDAGTKGIALDPSGGRLFDAVQTSLSGPLGDGPAELATQLTDALVEQFELVRDASPELDPDGNRLTVSVSGSVYGSPTTFDHPVVSVLAVGLAAGLDRPMSTAVEREPDREATYLVTIRWPAETA